MICIFLDGNCFSLDAEPGMPLSKNELCWMRAAVSQGQGKGLLRRRKIRYLCPEDMSSQRFLGYYAI